MPKAATEVVGFASAAEWSAWLAAHHDDSPGVWLRIAKKGNASPSVTYAEAVEAALCWGWIDGQKAKAPPAEAEAWWLQRFTPRTTRSPWSKINRDKATALIGRGAMQPPGLREVERAKADGRWDAAYDPPSAATVPDDLAAALEADPAAQAAFEALDRTNRYAILYRLQSAKRPETRARKVEQFVEMLREGRTLHG